MRTLDREAPARHWATYRHIGNVRVHSVPTLLHVCQLYRPFRKPVLAQRRLHAAALGELRRRAEAGRPDAATALHTYNP